MDKLKTYYVVCPNMGDRLNVLIFEKVFGYTPVRHTPITCEISGIGSGLGKFCYSDQSGLRAAEHLTGRLWRKTYVWGTGFLNYRDTDRPFFRKDMEFCAVRGKLSKERVEKLIGRELDIPVCDGGILASELIDGESVPKKYNVGIIPHFREYHEPEFETLRKRFNNSVVIDLQSDTLEVIRTIAECEYIISSGLHGLIVADSLHIPNIHVKVTDLMKGDGFKFDDYYSGYGINHRAYKVNDIVSENFIRENYRIDSAEVEKKKSRMKEAFPFRH